MKGWNVLLVCLVIIGCNKPAPAVTDKTSHKKYIVPDDRVYPFTWNKTLAEYPQKKTEVIGFVWFDTITAYVRKGNYQVFERPNCVMCSPVNVYIENEIQAYEISDSLFPDPGKSSQWRLVKITGRVKNASVMEAERIERAEYSYPDYEESGYIRLDVNKATNKDKVYADGLITPGIPSTAGFVPARIKNGKENIPIRITFGSRPNQAENFSREEKVNIRDQNGTLISGKKVRVYGLWSTPETKELWVESIKILN